MADIDLDFDLSAFANAIEGGKKVVVQKIALDLHAKIARRTPVDTGRARSSWNLSLGAPDLSVPPEGKHGPPPPPMDAGSISGNETVWIASNLDYIEFLEKGGSNQAPAGMVEISMAEIEVELAHIAASLVSA